MRSHPFPRPPRTNSVLNASETAQGLKAAAQAQGHGITFRFMAFPRPFTQGCHVSWPPATAACSSPLSYAARTAAATSPILSAITSLASSLYHQRHTPTSVKRQEDDLGQGCREPAPFTFSNLAQIKASKKTDYELQTRLPCKGRGHPFFSWLQTLYLPEWPPGGTQRALAADGMRQEGPQCCSSEEPQHPAAQGVASMPCLSSAVTVTALRPQGSPVTVTVTVTVCAELAAL